MSPLLGTVNAGHSITKGKEIVHYSIIQSFRETYLPMQEGSDPSQLPAILVPSPTQFLF